jgi:hypothetical protein
VKRVLGVLKNVFDNPAVRSRLYELGIAVLTVVSVDDTLDGVSGGTVVKYVAGLLLVLARSKVQKAA